jgi:serine/threonine protein kinase
LRKKEFKNLFKEYKLVMLSDSSDDESSVFSDDTIGYHYPIENNETIGEYKILEKIGSGRFCRVYKVEKNNLHYAMKVYKSSSSYIEYYENEIKNHKILYNDNNYKKYIVELIETFMIESDYGTHGIILFELCGNSLAQLLNNSDEGTLPEPIVKHIMKQVLNGLKIFHNHNLIHTDLKPENLLLKKEYRLIKNIDEIEIKISDLGSSLIETEIDTYSVGTDQYLPPEVILRAPYEKSIDIWGVGNVIFELLTGNNLIDPDQYFNDCDSDSDLEDEEESNYEENEEEDDDNNSSICSDDDDDDCGNFEYIYTHIALFHKVLGPIPKELIEKGENYDLFYRKSGKLNRIPRYIEKTSIKEILETEYSFHDNQIIDNITNILEYIFKYMPCDRPSIDQLLNHKWFQGDFKKQYQDLLEKINNKK